MINKFILLLSLMMCTYGFSQTIDYNTKNGYAVQGYDVVSYFDKTPLEGKEEFFTTFDGVKFKFYNAKNLKRFEESPFKYLPKYGGYCAYAVAVNGKKVNVDPETYEKFDKIILTHTVRNPKELAYEDMLRKLNSDEIYSEVTKGKFVYFNTVTRDKWPRTGRITQWIRENKLWNEVGVDRFDPKQDRVMICGSEDMTNELKSMFEKLGSKKAAKEWFVSRQPMGRLGQPDEIGSLIIYLLSDAGSYATGQPFIVDGGTIA